MYCSQCGSQLPDNTKFCPSCGAGIVTGPSPYPGSNGPHTYNPYLYYQMKNTGLSLLLAFFIPGAGHIYAGKITKGLMIMGIFFLVGATTFISMFFALGLSSAAVMILPYQLTAELTAFMVVVSVLLLVVWIYQLFDAYSVTKKYNDALLATGQEPW